MRVVILGRHGSGKARLSNQLHDQCNMRPIDAENINETTDFRKVDIVNVSTPEDAKNIIQMFHNNGERVVLVYITPKIATMKFHLITGYMNTGADLAAATASYEAHRAKEQRIFEEFDNANQGALNEDALVRWENDFTNDALEQAVSAVMATVNECSGDTAPHYNTDGKLILDTVDIGSDSKRGSMTMQLCALNHSIDLDASEFCPEAWAVICKKLGVDPNRTLSTSIGADTAMFLIDNTSPNTAGSPCIRDASRTCESASDEPCEHRKPNGQACGTDANTTYSKSVETPVGTERTCAADFRRLARNRAACGLIMRARHEKGYVYDEVIPISELIERWVKEQDANVIDVNVSVIVAKDQKALTVQLIDDDDYPGIDIDAADTHGKILYIGHAELPNDDYKDSVTARLYAGYAALETDEPVCMMRHRLLDDETLNRKISEAFHDPNWPAKNQKCVHIDYNVAVGVPWEENPRERLTDKN